jgi:hypothetical protein
MKPVVTDPSARAGSSGLRRDRLPGRQIRFGDRARGVVGWALERRLMLAVGLIAALPVIVSTARAVAVGWTPVFDDALIATNAFDVFTGRSDLLGMYSEASLRHGEPVFSLGPMLFWLLALQARFLGDWALPVTAGMVNTASIMGVVALAHRRGGRAFMFTTAVAVTASSRRCRRSCYTTSSTRRSRYCR